MSLGGLFNETNANMGSCQEFVWNNGETMPGTKLERGDWFWKSLMIGYSQGNTVALQFMSGVLSELAFVLIYSDRLNQ